MPNSTSQPAPDQPTPQATSGAPSIPDTSRASTSQDAPQLIFLGNGPLADAALDILQKRTNIVFHAHTRTDLDQVVKLKRQTPSLHAVLASYGVIIPSEVLDLFEPEGVLNLHPSLLPLYRGPSPIETAILQGDTEFGISVMKLVPEMDAGPLYHQESLHFAPDTPKSTIYRELAQAGARWIADNLEHLPPVSPQGPTGATYTPKLTKSLSRLDPALRTSLELFNEIRAYQGWPKSKYTYHNIECTILQARISDNDESSPLSLLCKDGKYLIPDRLQPANKNPMDARSFINGYLK